MAFRVKLLLVVLAFLSLVTVVTLYFNWQEPEYKPGVSEFNDKAVNQAQTVYKQKKDLGVDFTSGPCLSNDLLPNWVADIIHSPRNSEDNYSQNQCQAFLEGRAKHFVELDIAGNVVRVK